jgi:predicted RNA-binding Zn-ribbon protein involved in translation (DUF1610 family)
MSMSCFCSSCRTNFAVSEESPAEVPCPQCGTLIATSHKPAQDDIWDVLPAARDREELILDVLPASAGQPAASACSHCGRAIPTGGRNCPYCGRLPDEDDDADEPGMSFKPCPRCNKSGAERVVWTPWGSFYGPYLLSHVRCPGCGYKYNGKTGRSNLVPAVIFVVVPLLGILFIVGGLAVWLYYSLGSSR